MSEVTKRSTIYFKPELHRALRIKAAETQRSLTDLVNDAVQMALREDEKDISAGDSRVSESTALYEGLLKDLKTPGKVTFSEVLESADKLSLDEKETLIEILKRRLSEYRRAELVKEIQNAEQEYQNGQCRAATPSEIMKEMKEYNYRIILHKAIEGGYTVIVPALPGCITEGDTLEEAKSMAKDAIKCYIESLVKDGEPIPDEDESLETFVSVAQVMNQ
jgi:predicted RNase H-like HicB family nuclease/predicted CopG family antitoxin